MHLAFLILLPRLLLLGTAGAGGGPLDSRPVAYVHIGPHKTATSHFQSVCVELQTLLSQRGVSIWPYLCKSQQPHTKSFDLFGMILRGVPCPECPTLYADTTRYFAQQLQAERKLLLSAENMFQAISANMSAFLDSLSGYRIHVIVAHRLPSALLVSFFDEEAKNGRTDGLSSFLHGDRMNEIFGILPLLHKLRPALAELGGRLSIIDYYGMVAANQDISYVVFCEIMGVLCNFNFNSMKDSNRNPSVPLDNYALETIFAEYARGKSCFYRVQHPFRLHAGRYKWGSHAAPTTDHDLSEYNRQALHIDHELRLQYIDELLHPNRTANEREAAARATLTAVDPRAVRRDPVWTAAFDARIEALRRSGGC